MDKKSSRKKKTSQTKSLHRCSSKKLYSCTDFSVQAISSKTKGKTSEDIKDSFLKTSKKDNFKEGVLTDASNIEEKTIQYYAERLSKTEKIWSQNISHSKQPNALEKANQKQEGGLKTNSLWQKGDVERNSVFWKSAVWKDLDSFPKSEDPYAADNLLTEIKSLVLDNQPERERMSPDINESSLEDKDSKSFLEHVFGEKFDYLDKLLDDDSAYGSDESLSRGSPEPTDIEAGVDTSESSETFEDCADCTESDFSALLSSNRIVPNKIYSKLYSNQNPECICGGSDYCDMHKTGEFQEFLKGLDSTKPRKVVHEIKKCAICRNEIVDEFSLINRFGLLLNCEHSFCYRCIFSACYRKKSPVSIFNVRCPVCNTFSPGVVSSPRWLKSKIKKANMFKELKLVYIEWLIFKLYLNGKFFKL